MEIIIDNIKYETTQLENGKWTLPEEIKKCLRSCCGALDIDSNRVPSETPISIHNAPKGTFAGGEPDRGSDTDSYREQDGRYPAQTFIDDDTAEVLDRQSGKCGAYAPVKSGQKGFGGEIYGKYKTSGDDGKTFYGSMKGCSKILHKCNYELGEYDIYSYMPKVSKSERNAGCDELEEKVSDLNSGGIGRETSVEKRIEKNGTNAPTVRNNHPTLKPIKLNERILKLFKTPNEQKIIYPFAGSGSEIIGGIKAGFTNWVGCEINPDYVEIAKARIDYWSNKFDDGLDEMMVEKKIDESQVSLFDLMEDQQ